MRKLIFILSLAFIGCSENYPLEEEEPVPFEHEYIIETSEVECGQGPFTGHQVTKDTFNYVIKNNKSCTQIEFKDKEGYTQIGIFNGWSTTDQDNQ